MKMRNAFAAGFALAALSAGAWAQIAVSGNDGKQMRPGDEPPGMRPDTVSVIDMNVSPPKVLATIDAPASLVGPPDSVAVAPDSSFAIVTCSQKRDPSDPNKLVLGDAVSVIDLANPSKPKVVQRIAAGDGAAGVSINRAGTMALVANLSGSVSVFTISHKRLTKVGTLQMGYGSAPSDPAFLPDGKHAYVLEAGRGGAAILDVNGSKVTNSGQRIATGSYPYSLSIAPVGGYAVNTNMMGGMTAAALRNLEGIKEPPAARSGPRGRRNAPAAAGPPDQSGKITLIDLRTNKVVDSAVVGNSPEHAGMSPDGKYVEVTVANNAIVPPTSPKYRSVHGLMRIFAVSSGKLTPIATADTGHWCQGVAWSKDDHEILLQCSMEREIEVFHFNGKSLTQDAAATLHFNARPGAIATADNQ
jgi:DNA-binding beta-propeller fold protein YncE